VQQVVSTAGSCAPSPAALYLCFVHASIMCSSGGRRCCLKLSAFA
jgi:hypothetical protein